tara:strand:+ start:32 stop:802 length:771 start_codon:yes stop_codon:yes gene_type:complete
LNIIQGKLNFLSLFKRNLIYKLKKKINIDLQDDIDNSSLDELFKFYNTDKANSVDNGTKQGHGFAKFYEKNLNQFKDKKEINILEIGSFSGASAAAFSKYFLNSQIYCLDINIRNFKFYSKRIHVFGMDSSNYKMMTTFLNKINFFKKINTFDIIIDDGSHILSDQLLALNFFYKFIGKSGFYIVEDYKLLDHFNHLKDVNDISIEELANNVRDKKTFTSKIISDDTINDILQNNKNIYEYKGNTEKSDIIFFEKK